MIVSGVLAQSYCLKFTKEGNKSFLLSVGKNISFVLNENDNWNKGKIVNITTDSLFIEEYNPIRSLSTERQSNFEVIAYALADFDRIAFRKTSKVIEGTALYMVYVAAFTFSSGTVVPAEEDDGKLEKKLFRKNINFNENWKAEIVQCVNK